MEQRNNEELMDDGFMEDDFMADRSLCSATDCTGLIPALPVSEGEIASYEQLYHFLPRAKSENSKT